MERKVLENQLKQEIHISIFYPEKNCQKLVLINSATAVRQQLYYKFSTFLAENGFTVITYDYGGIGLSKPKDLRKSKSSMLSWGTEDFARVTNYINLNFKVYRKYLIGHSVGALILGLHPNSQIFERLVFISTQRAYVGDLNFKIKILAYLGFGVLQPFLTKILGYFPAQLLGLGESLPANVAKDWRTLILNKNSTNALLEKIDQNISINLDQPVLMLWTEDDAWLTKAGVTKLFHESFPQLKPNYRLIKTEESPQKEIGHINFFRSFNEKLWNIILDELEK